MHTDISMKTKQAIIMDLDYKVHKLTLMVMLCLYALGIVAGLVAVPHNQCRVRVSPVGFPHTQMPTIINAK